LPECPPAAKENEPEYEVENEPNYAMSTIDAHVHLYPPEINRDPSGWAAAHGESLWGTLCTRRRKDGRAVQDFPSVDELLRQMDEAAVGRAVLLGWYWTQAESCVRQNRFYAECVRAHPDRLSAFASVQPAAGGASAVEELRQARDSGLIGVGELSPHAQGYDVASPDLSEVLAAAADWSWALNLHVTDPATGKFPGRVETPLADFHRLARAWPRVTFILAHWGGGLAWAKPRSEADADGLHNVYYDTAASPLLYDAGVWARAVAAAGASRILFGSDFPLNAYPKVETAPEMRRFLAEVRAAPLADEERSAILGGNARRILALG